MVSKYSIFASIFLAIGFVILLVSLYAAIPSYSPSKPFTKNLYSCSINQDCGLNICDCVAQRDDTIENSDRACARFCDGTVKCINQKCQLVKPTLSPAVPPNYRNEKYGIEFQYPTTWIPITLDENKIALRHLNKTYGIEGNEEENPIVIFFKKSNLTLEEIEKTFQKNRYDPIITRLSFDNFISDKLVDYLGTEINIKKDDLIITISVPNFGVETTNQELEAVYNQILNSLKFINQIGTYTCPATEWVDCMPIIVPERQFECEKPYLDWVKINCPNFRGISR